MDMMIAKSLSNGGRALDAVWENPNFTPHEKLYLLYIGSQLDFGCEFTETARCRRTEVVSMKIGIGEGTLRQVVDALLRRRYVQLNESSYRSVTVIMTDTYVLTDKIWTDYAEILEARRERARS